jgi:hypothetical protein
VCCAGGQPRHVGELPPNSSDEEEEESEEESEEEDKPRDKKAPPPVRLPARRVHCAHPTTPVSVSGLSRLHGFSKNAAQRKKRVELWGSSVWAKRIRSCVAAAALCTMNSEVPQPTRHVPGGVLSCGSAAQHRRQLH